MPTSSIASLLMVDNGSYVIDQDTHEACLLVRLKVLVTESFKDDPVRLMENLLGIDYYGDPSEEDQIAQAIMDSPQMGSLLVQAAQVWDQLTDAEIIQGYKESRESQQGSFLEAESATSYAEAKTVFAQATLRGFLETLSSLYDSDL